MKIPRALSQSATPNHSNHFSFILPLSEEGVGEAWGNSNKVMLSPPPHNIYVTSHWIFRFHLLLYHSFTLFSLNAPEGLRKILVL
jgi:hypothetical protein